MPTAAFGHALAGCGKGRRFCVMLSSIRRQLEGAVPRSLSALSTNQHLGEATSQGRAGELPPDQLPCYNPRYQSSSGAFGKRRFELGQVR